MSFHISCNVCWSTDFIEVKVHKDASKLYACNCCGSFFDDNSRGVLNVISGDGENISDQSGLIKDE